MEKTLLSEFEIIRRQLEDVAFDFERVQLAHMQSRGKEYKFVNPSLDLAFSNLKLKSTATKYYLKRIDDLPDAPIGFVVGKTNGLLKLECIAKPNAVDSHAGNPAWINKDSDLALDNLIKSVGLFLAGRVNGTPAGILYSFESRVANSQSDHSKARLARLATAPKLPKKVLVQTHVFLRNPDVVAEVLFRANGRCERCQSDAPFIRRSDCSPYLEVHHRLPLADGGEDTVENAIALCPNCHREMHYG